MEVDSKMKETGKISSGGERELSPTGLDLTQRHTRFWGAQLGVVMIVLGILAISLTLTSDLNFVLWLSWIIFVGGMAEAIHALYVRKSEEFFLHLVPSLASVPLGLLVATHPEVGIVTWMLVFAWFFTVVGLFRFVAALRLKFPGWRWAIFDSVVVFALGCVFWTTRTWLGARFFDVAVGTSLILRGWSTVMSSFAFRNPSIPTRAPLHTSATAPRNRRQPAGTSKVEATDVS